MNNLFFPAAVWIDNVPLTDQGRSPIVIARDERMVENELATGTRKRYVKAVKKQFSWQWVWMPDADSDTIDGNAARQTMAQLIGESPEEHTLRFFDRNAGWTEYIVFCSAYEETLIKRDPNSGGFFWEISVEFIEA